VDWQQSSPVGVSKIGEAGHFTSGAPGAGTFSWAWYRLLMGGEQPGAVSVDVNLLSMGDGSPSAYYLGLSDYGRGAWRWHGPFRDHHIRLSVPPGDYTSGLGNLFICVAVFDGAIFDVVGVAANPPDEGDTIAPATPTELVAVAVVGGIELTWSEADDPDLAGYRVFHSTDWFYDGGSHGVTCLPYLEGTAHHLLQVAEVTYVRLSAVDTSGNESALSDIVNATPLAGVPAEVQVGVEQPTGLVHDQIELSASGAQRYDWDLDGDGFYELLNVAEDKQNVNTSKAGVIRPALRGLNDGGQCMGCGGVSVLIGTNSRPLAVGYVNPAFGPAPLSVTFTGAGEDDDGTIIGYAWDFDGDGSYDYAHATEPNPPVHEYDTPGTYNAKFRVEDNLGLTDVDTVAVNVSEPSTDHGWVVVTVDSEENVGDTPCLNIVGGCPAISYSDYTNGSLKYALATTSTGADAADWSQVVTVDVVGDYIAYTSLAVVGGCPAISYADQTESDLKYARSETSTGASASDWTQIVTVSATDNSGSDNSLAVVDGCPAISYMYYSVSSSSLMYARAMTSTGGSPSDWTQIVTVDGPGDISGLTSLTVVDGCPAIAYRDSGTDDLKYARATTSTGSNSGDWTQVFKVADCGTGANWLSMAVVDGCPAISYKNSGLWYARATTADGGSAADWTQVVCIDSGLYADTSLAVIDDHPAIAYWDISDHDLMYATASTSTGGSPADWTEFMAVDRDGDTGYMPSLKQVDGQPAIAYYDCTNADLKYAYYQQ
jgi:hypothetical protein